MSVFRENENILRTFEKDGDDLSKPRIVDFQHIFQNKHSARDFAEAATSSGFFTEVTLTDRQEYPFDVVITEHLVPSCQNITDLEVLLDGIARQHGGHADGWGFLKKAPLEDSAEE